MNLTNPLPTNGEFVIKSGRVVTEGAPPYRLPEDISETFIRVIFSKEPGEDGFIGELAPLFGTEDKRRFRVRCEQLGGDVWRIFCRNASKWASIINSDNKWHLDDFTVVYATTIGSWWADDILITSSNVRFVSTSRGLFSFPEFQWQYGQNILEHLVDYQTQETTRLDDVMVHITSELIPARFTIADAAGNILVKEFTGLQSQPFSEWPLPEGCTFLSATED